MNKNYMRVMPRDLFNEAKLLKCMGRLMLLIHDNRIPVAMSHNEPDKFDIALMDEGSLTICNLEICIKGKNGLHPYLFKTIYNSKSNFPLFVQHENCDYLVFDEEGYFTEEFDKFCNIL
jgi:hypothetical protein